MDLSRASREPDGLPARQRGAGDGKGNRGGGSGSGSDGSGSGGGGGGSGSGIGGSGGGTSRAQGGGRSRGRAGPGGSGARRVTRGALLVLTVALAFLLVDGWRLWRAEALNAAIARGSLPAEGPDDPPELRYARAAALAGSGEDAAALERWRGLQADTPLGQSARYNAANALMREAARLRATPQPGQAVPMIELAKETYREILRLDPERWDARYNLERAQRLLPDPEDVDDAPDSPQRRAERAPTTMRAFAPGLP